MVFEDASDATNILPSIRLVGVGGAGTNILTQIYHQDLPIDFIAMDTSGNDLESNIWQKVIKLGDDPKGLGCGANPEKGRLAALKSAPEISDCFKQADMIILVAGLGGGVGSGSLPIIANIAKQVCNVVVCFTVMPFSFEGRKRTQHALDTYRHLQEEKVAIVMMSNRKIVEHFSPRTPLVKILAEVGLQLTLLINNFIGIITSMSLINIDFSDMKTILSSGGDMFIGCSSAMNDVAADIGIEEALINEIIEPFNFAEVTRSILLIEAGNNFNLGNLYDIGGTLENKSEKDIELIMGVNLAPSKDENITITVFMLCDFLLSP